MSFSAFVSVVGMTTMIVGGWNSTIDAISRYFHPTGIDFLRDRGSQITATALANALIKESVGRGGLAADLTDALTAAVLIKLVE